MAVEITITYIVYGCNDEGKPQVDSMFRDERLACRMPVPKKEKYITIFLLWRSGLTGMILKTNKHFRVMSSWRGDTFIT